MCARSSVFPPFDFYFLIVVLVFITMAASQLFMLEWLTLSYQCQAGLLEMKAIQKQNMLLKSKQSLLNLQAKRAMQ